MSIDGVAMYPIRNCESIGVCLVLVLVSVAGVFSLPSVSAATVYTWDAPSDGIASLNTNWDPVGVPGAGDSLIFDATSVFNCTWDLAVTITGFSMMSDYTGKVSQSANLIVASMYVGGGTWTGSTGFTLTVTQKLQINATGIWQPAVTKLIMDGSGATITGSLTVYSLHIADDASLLYGGKLVSSRAVIITENGNIVTIASGKTLTLGMNTTFRVAHYASSFSFSNDGLITGDGRFELEHSYASVLPIVFGIIESDVRVMLSSGVASDRTCFVGDGDSILQNLWIYSGDTIDRFIFRFMDTESASFYAKNIFVGERTLLRCGAANIVAGNLSITNIGTGLSYTGPHPIRGSIWAENSTIHLSGHLGIEGAEDSFHSNSSTIILDNADNLAGNPLSPMYTPTYDGNNTVVHPSVVRFDEAWNGWNYWMVITPFGSGPNADDSENPSILVSENGYVWTEPDGIVNPVVPYPGTPNFSADACMLYNDDTDELWFWYACVIDLVPCGFITKSSDGITWSAPVLCNEHKTSISVIKIGEIFYAWDVSDTLEAVVSRSSSTDGITWGDVETGNVIGTIPDGKAPWHYDIQMHPVTGQYWMLMSCGDLPTHVNTNLLFAYSDDGLDFTIQDGWLLTNTSDFDLWNTWDGRNIYRCSMLFDSSNILRVWYSGAESVYDRWQLGYTTFEYSHVDGIPVISPRGFSILQWGAIAPYEPYSYELEFYNLEIPSNSRALVGCDLTIRNRLVVGGVLYGPDATILVQSEHPIPIAINGSWYGDIEIDSAMPHATVYGPIAMTGGSINTNAPTMYLNTTVGSFSVSPSTEVTFQITKWNSRNVEWIVTESSSTIYSIASLDWSVGYKVYLDGKEIYRQHSGYSIVSFTVSGIGEFEVSVWDPYAIWDDTASLLMPIALCVGIAAIFMALMRRGQRG